ncbi:MAG: thioredoxin domain-containing protein, partial [Gemmatimonadetes bacterium]|nr:thioredoxin domain-containing protein [Gemmatimonadota bacterium]
FPPSARLTLLLRHYYESGSAQTLNVVKGTLGGMLKGGMYDQLGGGFHRYSVDEKWLIPHFEKMLYDNALLAPVYLAAYQVTGEPEYRRITDEILAYLMNEMSFDRGGFYSSEDADSEGEEGKFYVWTPGEIRAAVGEDDADLVMARYGVTPQGNFEHNTTTLFLARTIDSLAAEFGRPEQAVREALANADAKMLAARAKRIRPGLDDKALASWNALAITAFARAGRGLGEARYVERAVKAARFMQENMVRGDILMHTYKEGEAKIPGYLDDYTFYVQALLDLYETTFDIDYLERAMQWKDRTMELFADPAGGGFHYSGSENEELIAQAKNFFDGSIPSGNSIAAMNLARLVRFTGNKRYEMELESLFSTFAGPMSRSPGGTAAMLNAFAFHYEGAREIVIVGGEDDPVTGAFVETVSRRFIPDAIFVYWNGKDRKAAKLMPVLEGKENVREPTAFLCRDYVCDAPITSAEVLRTAMAAPYETGGSAR